MSDSPDPNSGERIDISVPVTYLQTDDTVWEDLEELIFRGFLTSHAEVQGQHFVFKTLNHLEIRAIESMRTGPSSSPEARSQFRASFIAHSIFMANGTNVLWERPRHISRLVKTISRLSSKIQDKIIENLGALNERSSRAYPLTEVYSHENRSRFRWSQYRNLPLGSPSISGVPGTELIGLNNCQLTWTAVSNFIDKRDEMEREWANAKFVGSCMAGKGIRSIDERDRMRQERERVNLEEKKMSVLKSYLNRTVGDTTRSVETVSLPDGRTAEVVGRFRAESAQELASQLSAALNQEKDSHDLAVEAQIQKIRQRSFEIEKERRAMVSESIRRPAEAVEANSYVIPKGEADFRMKRIREAMLETRRPSIPDSEASDTDF